MKTPCLLLASLLTLTACSAEVDVATEPIDQSIPLTSLLEPVYLEIALDLPEESQGDVTVQAVAADLTVVNPTRALTLALGIRLSLEGRATPGSPVPYTDRNLPAYFPRASVVLPTQDFAPGARMPVHTENPVLQQALGKPRIWIIVNNTVRKVGLGGADTLPVNIRLEDIVFSATVTKPFPGVGGGLEVGGL
ncbi:hypothetical protein [Stigmatella erecta]|uniref:Late embryogenesis abundant protein n=1 Tax=Stigmatella erecta TaxID=83460 RepID=A0A1I0L4U1_9BACT|nr:hypothetical protein [Stigmatella erecta]SEU34349.1 hypothetical protein SAMN05443639_11939 [Stigmatella erecta]